MVPGGPLVAVASWGEGGGGRDCVRGNGRGRDTGDFFVRLAFVGLKLFRSVWTIAGLWDL